MQNSFFFALVTSLVLSPLQVFGQAPSESEALELFQQRIMPIFNSDKPSSCVQCHLSSVDLKDYIRTSSKDTFFALRAANLVDLKHPDQSKILNLISMGERDTDRLAARIHAKTRDAEYTAFAAWITACCQDPKLTATTVTAVEAAGPDASDAVVRYNRKDRVLNSFVRNIWSQRMRCFPCHTPNEIPKENTKAATRHADFVKQYGQRMNLFKASPEATLRTWITNSRKLSTKHLPLINEAQPTESLILLKPMAKLPPKLDNGEFQKPASLRPVSHMGGVKMHAGDTAYKAWLTWIEDFARVKNGVYASQDNLPSDNWYPTNQVLRVKNTPADWTKMSLVQLFVYGAEQGSGDWSATPMAFTQSLVTPRGMVNGSLFLLASPEEREQWQAIGQRLKPGRYLIRAYVDWDGRVEQEPSLLLCQESEHDGQLEIEAEWRDGFPNAELVNGSDLQDASAPQAGD